MHAIARNVFIVLSPNLEFTPWSASCRSQDASGTLTNNDQYRGMIRRCLNQENVDTSEQVPSRPWHRQSTIQRSRVGSQQGSICSAGQRQVPVNGSVHQCPVRSCPQLGCGGLNLDGVRAASVRRTRTGVAMMRFRLQIFQRPATSNDCSQCEAHAKNGHGDSCCPISHLYPSLTSAGALFGPLGNLLK